MTPAAEENKTDLQPLLRDFLNANFALLKILAIHQPNNDAVKRPLSDYEKALAQIRTLPQAEKGIEIKFDDGIMTVMGIKLKPHFSIIEAQIHIPDSMEIALIESLKITSSASIQNVAEFYGAWAMHCSVLSKPKAIIKRVDGIQIKPLDLKKMEMRAKSRELLMDPVYSLHHHYMLKVLLDKFFYGFAGHTVISQKAIRRELIELSQVIRYAPYNVLALTFIRDTEGCSMGLGPPILQAVATSLLSMLLANEIGLSVTDQVNLGMVGLLYNVGLLCEASAVVTKKEALTEDEYKAVVDAQFSGVFKLIKAQGQSRPVLERLLAIFEHAQMKQGSSISLTLESRLLRLASQYIALTSPRPFRSAYLRDEAMKILGSQIASNKADRLDPILYYFLVSLLGLVPVGSLVELSNQKKAVVTRPRGEKTDALILKMVLDDPNDAIQTLDLSEQPQVQILKTLDPDQEGIAISAYFFKRSA